jgi:hypothetical protein
MKTAKEEWHSWVPVYARTLVYLCDGPPSPSISAPAFTVSWDHFSTGSSLSEMPHPPTDYADKVDCLVIHAPRITAPDIQNILRIWSVCLHENGMVVFCAAGEVSESECLADTGFRSFDLQFLEHDAGKIVTAVRAGYSPLTHARVFFDVGETVRGFRLLESLPASALADPMVQFEAALEMQLALLAWPEEGGASNLLRRFFRSQQQFYKAAYMLPEEAMTYVCQAEFWMRVGNPDMARRLLRSIHHVRPESGLAQRLECIPVTPPIPRSEAPPAWDAAFHPRILVITQAEGDSGMDVLYDGLCRVLGADHVQEFPYKPVLHGEAQEDGIRHPHGCNHPGIRKDVEQLEAELEQGVYDLILFADPLLHVDRVDVLRLMRAAPALPVIVYDTWDDCSDQQADLTRYLRRPAVAGYFKREMVACGRYGPNSYPLPLAYADARVPETVSQERSEAVFFAGSRVFGLRRLYLEYLEAHQGYDFRQEYAQDEYIARLGASRVGLDIFGFGFDTVRYWEIPAHGAMLLAERKPLHIPHNFMDGQSALFFDDLPSLQEKLDYCRAHPEEVATIAAAGRVHFLQHHTASARACQFLGRVQQLLGR